MASLKASTPSIPESVEIDLNKTRGSLRIDGREIPGVRSLNLYATPDGIPTLNVEIIAPVVKVRGGGLEVQGLPVRETDGRKARGCFRSMPSDHHWDHEGEG